ncbi:MAG: hypothetical protein PHR35_12435, partial [Kiritimatiellae bacterium]|nr:hypothetical protein [Kiritimatiellia bacterium]
MEKNAGGKGGRGVAERLIRAQDWVYEEAGARWQDGLILGNGSLGVIGYAPYGLEWVLNKNDVFDGRTCCGRQLTHRAVMDRVQREGLTNAGFLNAAEPPPKGAKPPVTKSAALLRLRFGNETGWAASRPHAVRQRLCLWEGELYNELDMHLSHPRLRSFVPRDRNVFCLRLEHSGAALWNHVVELARPEDDALEPPVWRKDGKNGLTAFSQRMTHGDARYAVAVLVAPTTGPDRDDAFLKCIHPNYRKMRSGIGEIEHGRLQGKIPQNGNADIFVAVVTSYEARDPMNAAVSAVRAAARAGFASLERANQRWWRAFWEKSWADFGAHREIQKYWTFSLYETACLLGKAPVPYLYGLWHGPTDDALVGGIDCAGYVHDQNVQIPVMPVYAANHPELAEAFADTYLQALDKCRKGARDLFGRNGACLPLGMNALGETIESGGWRYTYIGGVYSGAVLAWAWRHTRDRKLLRERIYPLLREFVRFDVDGMTKGADGRYHLDWQVPPEIFTLTRDATPVLALLRTCLETVIEASRLLNVDVAERRHWEDVLAHYPDYPRHPDGSWWIGRDVPFDHYTQSAYLLYPMFPGDCGDADKERIAATTLAHMTDHDIEMSYADETGRWHYKRGWALFFPAVARLRLGQRKEAWAALAECIRLFSKPNGLFSHNPIVEVAPSVSEANLARMPKGQLRHADGVLSPVSEFRCFDAGTAATLNSNARRWVTPASEGSGLFLFTATETLLQSHGGTIRLFPGVPTDFTGRFHRLLAEGAFEVSAEMEKGKVRRFHIKALVGGKVRIASPWKRTPTRLPSGLTVETSTNGAVFVGELRKGASWLVQGS